jgi:hypothetical protein
MAEYAHTRTLTSKTQAMRPAPVPAVIAVASYAAATALSAHHPLSPALATALVLIASVAFFYRTQWWVVLLPALLPVIGLAPWTGWITFEEQDILILAAAAGGYARIAWSGWPGSQGSTGRRRTPGTPLLTWLTLALFAVSTLVAMQRGFENAGGLIPGWFQGYHESMNSVRLSKSFFEALLLLPLWQAAHRQNPDQAQGSLSMGLMLGLLGASLAAVWERAAFTGLLDFSSDYRTTGLFWEMHMGGAALDGFLALTAPFALRQLLAARTPTRWGLAALVLGLAAYACLTTFSRGVYVALVVALAVFLALHVWQLKQRHRASHAQPGDKGIHMHLTPALLLVAGFGAGAAWVFQTSGYRGLLAVLSVAALMLPLAHVLRTIRAKQWASGAAAGVLLSLVALAISWITPKGAYVAWGLALALTAAALMQFRRAAKSSVNTGPTALAGFLALLTCSALVADRWGETAGLLNALPLLATILAVCIAAGTSGKLLWPDSLRWQTSVAGALGLTAAVVAIFSGGNYMSDRFSTGERDLGGRQAHWRLGREMLTAPADWWLGKGLGRFPANYFLSGNPKEHPGDYRLKQEAGNGYLTLTGGLFATGWGNIFRITQRISEPGSPTVVTARARADKNVTLHFEVCEKHLLYNQHCVARQIAIKGVPGVWQNVRAELQGEHPSRGSWFAPRLIAFSMGMESIGGTIDIDNLALAGADGLPALANGDFSNGMAHWFFSSDKHHMPWHIKSLFMNVLFDQGILGATIWGLLLTGGVWRTSFGSARSHPLAPALAASLIGFAVIGLFDSLLDVPRLAWLFYLLLMIALTVRVARVQTRPPGPSRTIRAQLTLALLLGVAWTGFAPGQAMAQHLEGTPQLIRVGPTRDVKTIADSSILARAGAIVEVDAGDYFADVALWTQDRLTLKAVGGRVRLIAAGAATEGKAIWVMRGGQMSVEGFDFVGARVPDRNGAGIRFEKGMLHLRNCTFTDNENGILTSNQADAELLIENSEFGGNGYGDGRSHNLYVGAIGRLTVTGSYFHHAKSGHLLKSRAAQNHIFYNRLTDGPGGRASYELEFATGGIAYVVGNIIQQGAQTENPHLISFGAEGYTWPKNELYLMNNTLVDDRSFDGIFLRVKPGEVTLKAVNNLLVGRGRLESAGDGEYRNNFTAGREEFESAAQEDYRLKRGSSLLGKAVASGSANGVNLEPQAEYSHPLGIQAVSGRRHNPGALQSTRPASRP